VFDEEKKWLEGYLEGGEGAVNTIDKGKGKAVEEEEEIEDGTGIECQCCFAEYSFVRRLTSSHLVEPPKLISNYFLFF